MKKTVYIVNGSSEYENMFLRAGFAITRTASLANLMCFTGGADVTPAIYGDFKHPRTFNNEGRDEQEMGFFQVAQQNNIPCVGVCRGGQFLNVMSGGRMYQDVSNHTGAHELVDCDTGETIYVSSTHHQMMMPGEGAVLLASSTRGGYREWYDGHLFKRDTSNTDIEVLFYENTKSLCFQPHPEFGGEDYTRMTEWFFELIHKHLGV